MLPIVAIPELVDHYGSAYSELFTSAGYAHFQRYLSGLLISENKTVSGINAAFMLDPKDQSTLNRFLTHSRYEVEALNACRLSQLQSNKGTRMRTSGKFRGVLGLDDTLLSHYGHHFEEIKRLWDHAQGRYVYAHNQVNLYYSDPEVEYPVSFDLWQPVDFGALEAGLQAYGISLKADKELLKESAPKKWKQYLMGVFNRQAKKHPELCSLYRSKVVMGMDLLKDFFARYPEHDLPIAFDTWFTTPQMCRFIDQELNRHYVGALKKDKATLILSGSKKLPLIEFIQRLKETHVHTPQFPYLEFKGRTKTHGYYTYYKTHRLKNYGKVRLMINFDNEDLSDEPKVYISNCLQWRAMTMGRIYSFRWPVEPFHQEAKAEGLDKYQIRDFEAIKKHIACVVILFSMLTLARKDPAFLSKIQPALKAEEQSLAFWRRLIKAKSLLALIQWAYIALQQGKSWEEVAAPILKACL